MEKFHFQSELLVVAPEFAGNDFKWIDTITATHTNGNTEKINVLVFNVQSTEEIKPMLEQELKKLQALEAPSEQTVHNMAYLQKLIQEMEDGYYKHNAPELLLETISKCARRRFNQNDVIYLSGVSAITD